MPDPRAGNTLHPLAEVVFIAVAASVCGVETCVDMAEFGVAKEGLFREVLRLEHGVPSHDTFSRLFRALGPAAFHAPSQRVMAGFAHTAEGGGVRRQDGAILRPGGGGFAATHCQGLGLGLRGAARAWPEGGQPGGNENDAF